MSLTPLNLLRNPAELQRVVVGAALHRERERVGVGRCREIYPKVPSGAYQIETIDGSVGVAVLIVAGSSVI